MRRLQRGGTLVLALAAIAGLVAILAVTAASQRVEIKALTNRLEHREAEIAMDAGVQRFLAELELRDPNEPAALSDDWANLGQDGDEGFRIGRAVVRMQPVDLGSLVNLNTASQAQLERLPLSTEQIESLLDWRGGARDPRPEGAKDEYYNNLPVPYNTALREFETFDELLLVRGFNAQVLYEPQENLVESRPLTTGANGETPILADFCSVVSSAPNTTPTGQTRINVNGPTLTVPQLTQRGIPAPIALQIVQNRGRLTDLGAVIALAGNNSNAQTAILNNLTTVAGDQLRGKVNLNTAVEATLNSIPNLPEDVVDAIIARQSNGGFTTLGDLTQIPGMSGDVLRQTANAFTIQSSAFLLRISAQVGTARAYREVMVEITNGQPKIMHISIPPFNDLRSRWGWQADPTTETVLVEEGS